MSEKDSGSPKPYEYASDAAQEDFHRWLQTDPEMRARSARAREAAEKGEGPENPVSVQELIAQADEARRIRASRPG